MTLELPPQLESRLVQQARLRSLTLEAYLEELLYHVLPETPADTPDELTPRRAGSAKGLITIPDDYDDPLEDFKEYMY